MVVTEEEEFSAITDKIPQKPMTVAEGTSYTLVIVAALGVGFLFFVFCFFCLLCSCIMAMLMTTTRMMGVCSVVYFFK